MSAPHSNDVPGSDLVATLADFSRRDEKMAILTPEESTYESIQAALDAAESSGETVVVGGEIATDRTLTVNANCDLSRLAINYTGTGVAVFVGVPGPNTTTRRTFRLPKVVNTVKGSSGWALVEGSIGVLVSNVYTSFITVPQVASFETGLEMRGDNHGCCYNTVVLGELTNNKVNQRCHSVGTGWSNDNLFLGGRFVHYSNEYPNRAGTRHIQLVGSSEHSGPNNNLWVKSSLESPLPVEYQIETINGHYNRWSQCRYETWFQNPEGYGHATVRAEGSTSNNVLDGGLEAGRVNQVLEGGAAFTILSPSGNLYQGGTHDWTHRGSTSLPVLRVFRSGEGINTNSGNTDWLFALGASKTEWKSHTDAFARVRITSSGSLSFGSGTAEPNSTIRPTSAGLIFDIEQISNFREGARLGTESNPWGEVHTGQAYVGGQAVVTDNDARLSDSRTPKDHTHTTAQVTGLDAALAGKSDTGHTHSAADVGAEPAQWYGTQAEYDALGTKDPNRTYNILEG